MRRQNHSRVAMLLGFILGSDLEQYFRRAMSLLDGDPRIPLTRLDSLFFLMLTAAFVSMMVIRKPKAQPEA